MIYERSKRVSDSLLLVLNVVKRVLLLIQLIHVTYTNVWDYDANFSRDENGSTIFMGLRIVLLSYSFSFTKEHRMFVMNLTGLALVKSNLYLIRIIFIIFYMFYQLYWEMLLQSFFNPSLLIIESDMSQNVFLKEKSKWKPTLALAGFWEIFTNILFFFLSFNHIQFSLIHIYPNLTRKNMKHANVKIF